MMATWYKDTAERVIVTFVQAWLSAWFIIEDNTADKLFDTDVLTVGLGAAVLSILKALAATRFGRSDSASLVE